MEYCYHYWPNALNWYLDMLDKLQKQVCWTVSPTLAASLEPTAHPQNAASLNFSKGVTLMEAELNWLYWLIFIILVGCPLVVLIGWMIFLSLSLSSHS